MPRVARPPGHGLCCSSHSALALSCTATSPQFPDNSISTCPRYTLTQPQHLNAPPQPGVLLTATPVTEECWGAAGLFSPFFNLFQGFLVLLFLLVLGTVCCSHSSLLLGSLCSFAWTCFLTHVRHFLTWGLIFLCCVCILQ